MPKQKALQRSCNQKDDKIADDEENVRKVTAFEALDSMDTVSYFAWIHGDKQIYVILNELANKKIGNTQVTKR